MDPAHVLHEPIETAERTLKQSPDQLSQDEFELIQSEVLCGKDVDSIVTKLTSINPTVSYCTKLLRRQVIAAKAMIHQAHTSSQSTNENLDNTNLINPRPM